MPFLHHTPESLLPRSDSKNPATTCKGITTNGRPCRRALANTPGSSPTPSPNRSHGVLAVLQSDDGNVNNAAAFYCWQHKDQAEKLLATDRASKVLPLREKSSIDTLVDRLGVLEIEENDGGGKRKQNKRGPKDQSLLVKRDTLPGQWHNLQGPLMTVPENVGYSRPPPKQQSRSNTKASVFCCIRADDDGLPPSRQHTTKPTQFPSVTQTGGQRPPVEFRRAPISQRPDSSKSPRISLGNSSSVPGRPSSITGPGHAVSQTQTLLSLIPTTLSPQTTSVLLAELSKPISVADDEGYIYMFWLTPESDPSRPDDDVASSLLDSGAAPAAKASRGSEALQKYASQRRKPTQPQTVLLKIGRAANVHRRLSQWVKQCAYNITLIRFYPYNDSRSSMSAGAALPPRKVPHVHRVERLIHIELADKRVVDSGPCATCGKEHREWFEIEASRTGLKAVDEVIRRWVDWAERQV